MGKVFNENCKLRKSEFEYDKANLSNEIILDVEQILNLLEIGFLTSNPMNPDISYGIQFKVETKRPFPFYKRVHSISAIIQWDF